MRTVDKALGLLEHFALGRPEAGLSEIARLSGLDKATVLRLLSALARHGQVEQHPESKKYRLGPGVLRLARVREASFPVVSIIQPVLERLASISSETAHGSLVSGSSLMTVGFAEPQRATRVHIDPGELLPFHATASGIAYLAYASEDVVEEVLGSAHFPSFTERTLTSASALRRKIAETRRRGFSLSNGGFELEVIGIAAPIFNWSGHAYGAVSVASIAARMTRQNERLIAGEVVQAAVEITRAMGAEPDPGLLLATKALAA
jgi:DNA-binding IclR family transcriptional regulator